MFEFQYRQRRQPSAVKVLLIANVVAFLVDWLILQPQMGRARTLYTFGFVPRLAFEGGYLWQTVTHMFMHGGLGHIFFNMFALFMFGPHLERNMGVGRFVAFYFLCGLAAMGLQAALNWNTTVPMVGASGAIMGVVAGFGYFFPNSVLLVFGMIPVKAWKLVAFYAAYEFLQMVGNPGSMIANAAHFGGLVMGLLVLQLVYHKYPLFGVRKRAATRSQAGPASAPQKKDPWGTVIDLNKGDDGKWQ